MVEPHGPSVPITLRLYVPTLAKSFVYNVIEGVAELNVNTELSIGLPKLSVQV